MHFSEINCCFLDFIATRSGLRGRGVGSALYDAVVSEYCRNLSVKERGYFSYQEGKVAILDIDFHHGNGTQDIFYNRNDVLTVSIHGHPDYSYPYFSGYEAERGEGEGVDFNRNFPLPPRTENDKYLRVFNKAINLILNFNPDIIVVSLGFDILKGDPTGTFLLSPKIFESIGKRLISTKKPLLIIQEGGYNIRGIRSGSKAFFKGCNENRT